MWRTSSPAPEAASRRHQTVALIFPRRGAALHRFDHEHGLCRSEQRDLRGGRDEQLRHGVDRRRDGDRSRRLQERQGRGSTRRAALRALDEGFDPIATNGTGTYTIIVDNVGTQDSTGIKVRDTLPAGTKFLSVTSDQGLHLLARRLRHGRERDVHRWPPPRHRSRVLQPAGGAPGLPATSSRRSRSSSSRPRSSSRQDAQRGARRPGQRDRRGQRAQQPRDRRHRRRRRRRGQGRLQPAEDHEDADEPGSRRLRSPRTAP